MLNRRTQEDPENKDLIAARPTARQQGSSRLAASILVGALAAVGLFYGLQKGGGGTVASEIPPYTVAVQGLADRRGFEPQASYETQPGSTVRIVAQPATSSVLDLEFALYRRGESGVLVRIPETAARIQVERGTAVVEAEAGALVGTEPGLYELVLVIGSADFTAPASIARYGLGKLVREGGLQAHTFELRLLPTDGEDRAAGEAQKGGGGGGGGGGNQEPPGGGGPLSWEFYAEPCPDAESYFAASCGAYGELHFEVASSSCQPFDSGVSEQRFGYPGEEIKKPGERTEPSPSGGRRAFADGQTLPGKAPTAGPWAAIIDWQDLHGQAVGAVVDSLSGPDIPTVGYYVDDPVIKTFLGPKINDRHFVVKLCEIVEDIDTHGATELLTLGLSLGRVSRPTDPLPGGSCLGDLACHVERVLDHLRSRDVTVAAAAGNHHELLFPAVLDETIAVASLDLNGYLETGNSLRTWESPTQHDAIMPGLGLCVAGDAAPSGSSLSTAFLVGGLAQLLDALPGIDPHSGGQWVTQWSTANDCMVLAQGGVEHPYCNPEIENMLGGILQGVSGGCWDVPDPSLIVVAALAGSPLPEPPTLGLPQWIARNIKPAPEEDPCIPCTDDDSYPPWQDDLLLNLTRSAPLSEDVDLDALFLRSGDSFYEVVLSSSKLKKLGKALYDGLLLPGFGAVLEAGADHALYYVLKTESNHHCMDNADGDPVPDEDVCYWTSSTLLP